MTFDPNKPFTTRAGKRVEVIRILDNPLDDGGTIIGIDEDSALLSWGPSGRFFNDQDKESTLDLVNTPEPQGVSYVRAEHIVYRVMRNDDDVHHRSVCIASSVSDADLIAKALNAYLDQ